MSDIAIRVENLSKQYRIGERESYKTLRDVIADSAATPFRKLRSAFNGNGSSSNSNGRPSVAGQPSADGAVAGPSPSATIWALDDVSFEVKQAEVSGTSVVKAAGRGNTLRCFWRPTIHAKGKQKMFGGG